jgi:hypothetical protein
MDYVNDMVGLKEGNLAVFVMDGGKLFIRRREVVLFELTGKITDNRNRDTRERTPRGGVNGRTGIGSGKPG